MFSSLTGVVGGVTGLPVSELGNVLPVDTVLDATGVSGVVDDVSTAVASQAFQGIVSMVKNLKWEKVVGFVKTSAVNLLPMVRKYVESYIEPYKEYFRKHKVLMIFVAIVVGLILIPTVVYLALALVGFGVGFLIFLLLQALILGVGFVVWLAVVAAITIASLLVGAVVIGVLKVMEAMEEWSGASSDSPTGDGDPKKEGESDVPSAPTEEKKDK